MTDLDSPPGGSAASLRAAWRARALPLVGLAVTAAILFAAWQFRRELSRSRHAGGAGSRELPVLFELPAFRLRAAEGGELGLDELRGKVWVADFVFTSCAGTCPLMSARLGELQTLLHARLAPQERARLRLVSFSVDPARDTPERLRDYARERGAEPGFWHFLAGGPGEVARLAEKGFKLASGAGRAGEEIIHSSKFVLVDSRGRIRGYHEGLPGESLDGLLDDLRRLLLEP